MCESQHTLQTGRTYAHHAGQRGLSQRASDSTAIPLCWRHHDRGSSLSIHTLGKLILDRVPDRARRGHRGAARAVPKRNRMEGGRMRDDLVPDNPELFPVAIFKV